MRQKRLFDTETNYLVLLFRRRYWNPDSISVFGIESQLGYPYALRLAGDFLNEGPRSRSATDQIKLTFVPKLFMKTPGRQMAP